MTKKRLWQTIRMWLMMSSVKRVAYLRDNKIFRSIGENVTIMDRKIPLYAKLISIHNNVRIASGVTFATHDIIHYMLNNRNASDDSKKYTENIGCIEIMDNVFIGSNSTIVVTKDVPPNSVVGGVPAKYICSIDEYIAKREDQYPKEYAPKHQDVSDELTEYMWNKFYSERTSK